MATFTATALQDETLDALMWRKLGTTTPIEDVLELNRDIAGLGPYLPEGTVVTLPLLTATPAPAYDIIQLWD